MNSGSFHSVSSMDRMTDLLATFLDVQSRRSEIIAGNLANADTPGYQALDLDFAAFLQRTAQSALTPQFPPVPPTLNNPADGPEVVTSPLSALSIDGNTVDSGHEMVSLAEAGMQYLQGTALLQSRLRTIRAAIREGR